MVTVMKCEFSVAFSFGHFYNILIPQEFVKFSVKDDVFYGRICLLPPLLLVLNLQNGFRIQESEEEHVLPMFVYRDGKDFSFLLSVSKFFDAVARRRELSATNQRRA